MITLYIININCIKEKTQSIYNSLSEQRKSKYNNQQLFSQKLAILAGGYLLNIAFNKQEKDLNVSYMKNGKPYILNEKEFSISHSGDICLLAVANMPIGVDVQKHTNTKCLNIAKQFFYAKEYKYILNSKNISTDFFNLWSLKESFIKATGNGFSQKLNSFYFNLPNTKKCYDTDGKEIAFSFKLLDIEQNYSFAVCVKGIKQEIKLVHITS